MASDIVPPQSQWSKSRWPNFSRKARGAANVIVGEIDITDEHASAGAKAPNSQMAILPLAQTNDIRSPGIGPRAFVVQAGVEFKDGKAMGPRSFE